MAGRERTKQARARERKQAGRLPEDEQERSRAGALAQPSLGVFALTAAIYLRTLHPSIPGGDGGELITVASTLGVAHPPGYPLMTLLGKLATLLPFGSVAWRVNLMTALFGASAAGVLCHATIRWAGALGFAAAAAAGLVAGGVFAFSPLVWRYSVGAEVFALNNLLLAALLSATLAFWTKRRPSTLRWAALFFGLGMCNQYTLLLYAAPCALFLIWEARREAWWRRELPALAGIFLLGLLPYVVLPLAAARHPRFAWGDAGTLRGFLHHLLRRDYGSWRLGTTAWGEGGDSLRRMSVYAQAAFSETLWLGVPLAAAGLWASLRKQAGRARALAVWPLAGYCLYLLVFTSLSNIRLDDPLLAGVQARFWQQPDLLVCVWLGLGLAFLWERTRLQARLALLPAAAAVVLQLGLNFKQSDQRHNTAVRDFGAALLESLDRGALLITTNDLAWLSVNYLQLVEKVRTDVMVQHQDIMTYPWNRRLADARGYRLSFPGDYYQIGLEDGSRPLDPRLLALKAYSMRQFLRANYAAQPIYVAGSLRAEDLKRIQEDFQTAPFGVALRVLTPADEQKQDVAAWLRKSADVFDGTRFQQLQSAPRDSWEYFTWRLYQYQFEQLAKQKQAAGQ